MTKNRQNKNVQTNTKGSRGAGQAPAPTARLCFACGGEGHKAKVCPTVKQVGPNACWVCGSASHKAKACTNGASQVNARLREAQAAKAPVVHHVAANSMPVAHEKKELKKVARAIEERTEFGKPRQHRAGHRYNFLTRKSRAGGVDSYHGCERLGVVTAHTNTEAGEMLDRLKLNPTGIGPYTRLRSKAYSKYRFRRVKLIFIPELTWDSTETQGSLYIGANFNPDAELPYGETGLQTITEWIGNHMIIANSKASITVRSCELTLKLQQGEQIPLFVDRDDDDKFECQAQIMAVAGSPLASSGVPMALGEWFIDFDLDLYELNTTPSDIGNGTLMGFAAALPSATNDLSYFTSWCGDGDLIVPHDYATSNVSFVLAQTGSYVVELWSQTSAGAVAANNMKLGYVSVAGVADPVALSGSFVASSTVGNYIYYNIAGDAFGATGMDVSLSFTRASNGAVVAWPAASAPVMTSRCCFSAEAGAAFVFYGHELSAGTLGPTYLTMIKLDSIFHADGAIETRASPVTTLDLAMQRRDMLTCNQVFYNETYITDAEYTKVLNYLITNRASVDAGTLNYLIDRLELPMVKGPQPSIVPAVAAIASWAVATFGPMLAEKAINWITGKINGDTKPRERDVERKARWRKHSRREFYPDSDEDED